MAVARWDGSEWKDHGNGGTSGNTTSGTVVTSSAVTSFSPFTLASYSSANPLPVEILSFTATPENNNVLLKWQTANEINNDYFTIERSYDGIDFNKIGIVDGAGNSFSVLSYELTDNNLSTLNFSTWYYRLKQTDFDGSYTYSNIVAVSFTNEPSTKFKLFPNPTNIDNINISLNTTAATEVMIVIHDVLGKELYSKVFIYDSNTLRLPSDFYLPAGLYSITASTKNEVITQKIIIR